MAADQYGSLRCDPIFCIDLCPDHLPRCHTSSGLLTISNQKEVAHTFLKEKRILKFISGANVQIMVKRPLHGFVAPNAE